MVHVHGIGRNIYSYPYFVSKENVYHLFLPLFGLVRCNHNPMSQNHGNCGKLLFIHSYICQGIQIKNLFDDFLGLGFDLKHLKMNTYQVLEEINFAKDYQKDLYNKTILMGKKMRIKPINHIKKTFIPQKMWNFKTLKAQNLTWLRTYFEHVHFHLIDTYFEKFTKFTFIQIQMQYNELKLSCHAIV